MVVFRIDAKTGKLTPTGDTLEAGSPVCVNVCPSAVMPGSDRGVRTVRIVATGGVKSVSWSGSANTASKSVGRERTLQPRRKRLAQQPRIVLDVVVPAIRAAVLVSITPPAPDFVR